MSASPTASLMCIWFYDKTTDDLPLNTTFVPPVVPGYAVTYVEGCDDVFPSTGNCPQSGLFPLFIRGRDLGETVNVSFDFGTHVVSCTEHIYVDSTLIVCLAYIGNGTDGFVMLHSPASLEFVFYTNPNATVSFQPTVAIDCGIDDACNGNGRCDAIVGCQCFENADAGYWNGTLCDRCMDGFLGASCTESCGSTSCACYGQSTCSYGLTGVGCVCPVDPFLGNWTGADCAQCAFGFYGETCTGTCNGFEPNASTVCSGHGVCSQGRTGTGLCTCTFGYALDNHGSCATCAPGFYGASCQLCGRISLNESICSGVANCSDTIHGDGTCACPLGRGGVFCEGTCPTSNITGSVATCGYGACLGTSLCSCSGNWTTSSAGACDTCQSGYYGPTCQFKCTVNCVYGACSDGIGGTGTCVCLEGYWGSTCATPCLGTDGVPCSGHGHCAQATGVCACFNNTVQGFYSGVTCARCQSAYKSDYCNVSCPTGPSGEACSSRGMCWNGNCSSCSPRDVDYRAGITEVCGDACQVSGAVACGSACPSGLWNPPACDGTCPYSISNGTHIPCSAQGFCNMTTGVCACLSGYFGSACEFTCPGGTSDETTCSGRGLCTPVGTCVCEGGYRGEKCQTECPGGAKTPCSLRGVCNAAGTCDCPFAPAVGFWVGSVCDTCLTGFGGGNCSVPCALSSFDILVQSTECPCLRGLAGRDCTIACPTGTDGTVCSSHGVCNDGPLGTGSCTCDADYYGTACGNYCTMASCLAQNLFRPECSVDGICQCRSNTFEHWGGALCDTCTEGYWGVFCHLRCACNDHGSCARPSGICSCHQDAQRGFWGGTSCATCATSYFGVACTGKSFQASPAVPPASRILDTQSATNMATLPIKTLALPSHQLYLVGNQPVLVWNTSTTPFTLVATLNFGGSITIIYSSVQNTFVNGLVVFADGSRLRKRVRVGDWQNMETLAVRFASQHREATELSFADGAPSSPSTRRRSFREQSVAEPSGYITEYSAPLDVVLLFDPYFTEINAFFPDGSATTLTLAQHQVPAPTAITFSISNANTAIVTGASFGEGFVMASFFVTASSIALRHRITAAGSLTAPTINGGTSFCNATACMQASLCMDTLNASDTQVCIVHHTNGPLPVLFNSVLGNVSFAAEPLYSGATEGNGQNFTVSSVALDALRNDGYIAFYFPGLPSVVFGFDMVALEPFYFQALEMTLLGDPERVFSIRVDAEDRLLTLFLMLETSSTLETRYWNLFDLAAVTPDIVDADGSANITITGYGFDGALRLLPAWCVFGELNLTLGQSIVVPAERKSTSSLVCTLPASITLRSCEPVSVNVLFGTNRLTSRDDVLIGRPASAEANVVTTSAGDVGFSFVGASVTLTVTGFGFVDSPFAKCRLVNRTGSNDTVVLVMPAVFVSLTQVTCDLPADVTVATHPNSVVQTSHDGVTYGSISASFSVVSEQVDVVVFNAATIMPTLVAKRPTIVPSILVHAVDVQGNAVRRFTSPDGDRYGLLQPTSANASVLMGNVAPLKFQSTSAGWISTVMRNGVAVVSTAVLDCPTAGIFTFTVADVPFQYMKYSWNVTILTGRPVYIRVVDEAYYVNVWRVPARSARALNPGLQAFCSDICGNIVVDTDLIPAALRMQYFTDIAGYDTTAQRETPYVASTVVSTVFARVGITGTYLFNPVVMRNAYGRQVTFTLSSPVGIVDAYTTPALKTENCQMGQEYAVKNTFLCLPCPDHATCDGSTIIDQQPGYWRSDVTSAVLYACDTPYGPGACLEDGACVEGYEGPRCSTCQSGYGGAGMECVACGSAGASWGIAAAAIALCIAFVVFVAVVTLRPMDTLDGELVYAPHPLLYILRNTIAFVHMIGVISLVLLGVHGTPTFPSRFFQWFAQVSLIDLRISYLSCTLATDEFARFRFAVVAPLVIAAVAAMVLSIRLCVLHRHRYDVTQTLLSKADSVRRLSFSTVRKRIAKSVGKRGSTTDLGVPSKLAKNLQDDIAKKRKKHSDGGDDSASLDTSIASGEGVHVAERAAYLKDLFEDEVPHLPSSHPIYRTSSIARSTSFGAFEIDDSTAPKHLFSDVGDQGDIGALSTRKSMQVSFKLPGQRTSAVPGNVARSTRPAVRRASATGPPQEADTSYFYGSAARESIAAASGSFQSFNDVDVMVVFDDDEAPEAAAVEAAHAAGARARAAREMAPAHPRQQRAFYFPDNDSINASSEGRDEWYDNDSQNLLDDLADEPEGEEDDLYDYDALMLGRSAVVGAPVPEGVDPEQRHVMLDALQDAMDAEPSRRPAAATQLANVTREDEEAFDRFERDASPRAVVDRGMARRHVMGVPMGDVERRLFEANGIEDDESAYGTDSSNHDGTEYFETDSGIYFFTRDKPQDTAAHRPPRNPFSVAPQNPLAGRPQQRHEHSSYASSAGSNDSMEIARNPFHPWDHKKPEVDFPAPRGADATPHLDPMHHDGTGVEDPYWYSFAAQEKKLRVGAQGADAWKQRVAEAAVASKCVAQDGNDLFDVGLPLKHRLINAWLVSITITLFLFYPAVISACIRLLFCEEVEVTPGVYANVLEYDRTVRCASGRYKAYRDAAIVALGFYALALPLIVLGSHWLLSAVHRSSDACRWLLAFVCGGYSDARWLVGSLAHIVLMAAVVGAAMLPRDPIERRVAVVCVSAAALGGNGIFATQSGFFPRVIEMSRLLGFAIVATLVMMMDVASDFVWTEIDAYLCVVVIFIVATVHLMGWCVQAMRDLTEWSSTVREWVERLIAQRESAVFEAVCANAVHLRESLWKAHERTAHIVSVLYPAQEALEEAMRYHTHLEEQLSEKTKQLAEQQRELEEQEAYSGYFGNMQSSMQWAESESFAVPETGGGHLDSASIASVSQTSMTSHQLLAVEATALKLTTSIAIPAMQRRLKELKAAIDALQTVLHRYRRMVSFLLHLFEYYSKRMAMRETKQYEGRLSAIHPLEQQFTSRYPETRRPTTEFTSVGVDASHHAEGRLPDDASAAASDASPATAWAPPAAGQPLPAEEEDAFMMVSTLEAVYASEKVVISATTQLRSALKRLTNDSYQGAQLPLASSASPLQRHSSRRRKSASAAALPSFRDSMMAMSLKKPQAE